MATFTKSLSLSRRQRRALGEAVFALCSARIAMLVLPFSRTQRWAGRIAQVSATGDDGALTVRWAVINASRIVPGGRNCLVRALAAQRMLGRRGLASHLRIGAANSAERGFEAHAWLEASGIIVVGNAEQGRYSMLSRGARNLR